MTQPLSFTPNTDALRARMADPAFQAQQQAARGEAIVAAERQKLLQIAGLTLAIGGSAALGAYQAPKNKRVIGALVGGAAGVGISAVLILGSFMFMGYRGP